MEEKEKSAIAISEMKTPSFMDLIAQNINNPEFDAGKLNALIDANIRVNKIQAEIDFNSAMARLQPKLPQIERKTKGHNGLYASYEDLDRIVRPLYTAEGFSISFDTEGHKHIGILSHVSGHSKSATIEFPPDTSGNKTPIQAIISAKSYAQRNLLGMLLNLVSRGEDLDGDDLSIITNEQATEIDILIKETGTKKPIILKLAKVDDIRDIRSRDFNRVLNSLKALKLDQQGNK